MNPNKKEVVVTVDDAHVRDIQQIAQASRSIGMETTEILDVMGQITGQIDPDRIDALRQISGVISVDESRNYQIPPPDSTIQ